MSLRTVPRDPMVALALRDARRWCVGQIIDDRPAIAHAVRVADTIARHVEQPAPVLLAAALLHDSPEFAPPRSRPRRLPDQHLRRGGHPHRARVAG
ncbi:hypothetical protein ACFQX7_27950 [Luedemannella flava]